MATLATSSTTAKPSNSSLLVDSLPIIDMTTLSQSELHSLSLFSSAHLRRASVNFVVSPSVNRSAFNESASTRRQTYSRPSPHHHLRHRLAALLSKSSVSATELPPKPNYGDRDRLENRSIINCLRQLLSSHPDFQEPDFVDLGCFNTHYDFALPTEFSSACGGFPAQVRKRKRGRRPKVKAFAAVEREREPGVGIVNKNGVVDLIGLASPEEQYREELRKRTEGLQKEEELLGLLRDLDGQWCSRRKKRKIVDASEFGDALPTGWKLLLGLKRKNGRAWIYCRRYISPNGQQFLSCKDVSEYLHSMSKAPGMARQKNVVVENVPFEHRVSTKSVIKVEDNVRELKEITLRGIDKLSEVQIYDLFDCHICNVTFDERDSYLQHLLSSHKQEKSYNLGASVGSGGIIKDGKYEFCNKAFEERRSYDDHVDIHVRSCTRGTEEAPLEEMALLEKIDPENHVLSMRIPKMDALIDIAQNSIRESPSGINVESNVGLSHSKQDVAYPVHFGGASNFELNSDSHLGKREVEDVQSLNLECHQENKHDKIVDGKIEKTGDTIHDLVAREHSASGNVKDGHKSGIFSPASLSSQNVTCIGYIAIATDNVDHSKKGGLDQGKTLEVEVDFGVNSFTAEDISEPENAQQHSKEYVPCDTVLKTTLPLSQHLHVFPLSDETLVERNKFAASLERKDGTELQELRIEDIDQLKYSYCSGEEPIFSPEMEMDIKNNSEMIAANRPPALFESDDVNMVGGQQLRTVCIWCGLEFMNDALHIEVQSDLMGYMCSTCKVRTSGQMDMMGTGCS